MRLVLKYLTIGALLGGAVTILNADDTPTPGTTDVSTTTSVELTAAEMQANSQAFIEQVQEQYREVMRLQEKVRQAKDIIKLTCINDKLVQIKAQMNIVDSSNRQLQDALAKNSDERHSSYSQLEQATNAIRTLREEANTCVGEPELFKGEDGVTVTHPAFPDDPIDDNPWEDPVGSTDVEPPAYASLFF